MARKLTLGEAQSRLDECYPNSGLIISLYNGGAREGVLKYGNEDLPFPNFGSLLKYGSLENLLTVLRERNTADKQVLVEPSQELSVLREQMADRLISERIRLNMLRGHFAKALGISPTDLGFYESGRVAIPIELLPCLKRVGVDINFLVFGETTPHLRASRDENVTHDKSQNIQVSGDGTVNIDITNDSYNKQQ